MSAHAHAILGLLCFLSECAMPDRFNKLFRNVGASIATFFFLPKPAIGRATRSLARSEIVCKTHCAHVLAANSMCLLLYKHNTHAHNGVCVA